MSKYQTNSQAWDEVTASFRKSEKMTEITLDLYNQENFIGLSEDQRNKVYEVYTESIKPKKEITWQRGSDGVHEVYSEPTETKKKYLFQGTRFVPSYGDIDYDDCTVEAYNEEEAWKLLDEYTKMFTWSRVGITHVNDVKLEEAII